MSDRHLLAAFLLSLSACAGESPTGSSSASVVATPGGASLQGQAVVAVTAPTGDLSSPRTVACPGCNVINVDGTGGHTCNGAGIQAAINALPGGGEVRLLCPSYELSATLLVPASVTGVRVVGSSEYGTTIHAGYQSTPSTWTALAGDVFRVYGQLFQLENVEFQTHGNTSGALIRAMGSQGTVKKVRINTFAGRMNDGFVLTKSDLGAETGGGWVFSNIRVPAGNSGNALFYVGATAGAATVASTFITDLHVANNFGWATSGYGAEPGYGIVVDTLVDTLSISHSEIPPVRVMNSASSQAPRWIHLIDDFVESLNQYNSGTDIRIDDVRDFHCQGYVGTANVGIDVRGGKGITISDSHFVNIGRQAVKVSGGTGIRVHHSAFDETARELAGAFPHIEIGGASDVDITANAFLLAPTGPVYPSNNVRVTSLTPNLRIVGNSFSKYCGGPGSGACSCTNPPCSSLYDGTGSSAGKTVFGNGPDHGFVQDGSGMKHVRTTNAAMAVGLSAQPITWPTPFADANYTVTCSIVDNADSGAVDGLSISHLRTQTAGSVFVVVRNATASPRSGTINCVAVHDS